MPRICSLLFLLCAMILFGPSAQSEVAPPKPLLRQDQTTDGPRQFIVSGGTLKSRVAFMRSAGELRDSAMESLKQSVARYPVAHSILLILNPSVSPHTQPSLQIIDDPAGRKLQLDLSPDMDPERPLFQRTILHALLVELALRSRSPAHSSETIPAPPRWLVDALFHRFRNPNLFLAIDSIRPQLEAGRLPSLAGLLARPDWGSPPSSSQEEGYARCLLALLVGQQDARLKLPEIALETWMESSALSKLQTVFPSLGSTEAELQRLWALHLASLGTQRELVTLTGPETLRLLKPLLEIDTTDSSGNRSAFPIERFSDYIRIPGIQNVLTARQLELTSLLGRAHFLYSEPIKAYIDACGALATGHTDGLATRLRQIREQLSQSTDRLDRIHDYLNWFEAEVAPRKSSQFEEIYRMWDQMEKVPRNPYISEALDEWERRLSEEKEQKRLKNEEAEIERALRESRARSKKQPEPQPAKPAEVK